MKLRKRGLSYVDWVISLGTFLIAVIFIFILVRPQLETRQDKQSLMQIVETNFYEETEWTTREVPVYIRKLQDYYDSPPEPAKVIIEYDLEFHPEIIEQPPASEMEIVDMNPIAIQCISGICADQEFIIVFSPNNPQNKEYPHIQLRCQPDDPDICDASLGASISTSGIHEQQLAALSAQGYTPTKTQWKYPSANDFAIFKNNIPTFNNPSVPQQTNAEVKERKYWILEENNDRNMITLRFQVW
ncbi:MAG: hypothetical protein AABX72_01570 [Nanoarchaeota archaeon]